MTKKYRAVIKATIIQTIEVEAKDAEEAMEKVHNAFNPCQVVDGEHYNQDTLEFEEVEEKETTP